MIICFGQCYNKRVTVVPLLPQNYSTNPQ